MTEEEMREYEEDRLREYREEERYDRLMQEREAEIEYFLTDLLFEDKEAMKDLLEEAYSTDELLDLAKQMYEE